MKFSGLRARWMLNGIAILFAVIIIGVLAFALFMSNYYHTAVRTSLETKAKTAAEFFTTYVSRTYAEYNISASRYAQSFEDKDKLELQFINTKGRIEMSSYGLTAGKSPGTPDIAAAIETGEMSSYTGVVGDTGERIMAVSTPLLSLDGQVVGLMRYVTSMRLLDRQIFISTVTAASAGLIVMLLVLFSNLYFIKTITEPIHELTIMAKHIAQGSYGIQVDKKYEDEVGELIDTINDMSLKLGDTERLQNEFISSVSHELRTPLTAITGWSETLLYDESISGDLRRGVSIIAKEASRLTKMVEELLEFTRIQDGRFKLTVEQIDIESQLEDTIFTYSELLSHEEIRLYYTPGEKQLPLIPGDAERLRQVFLNIIDNAAKYGRQGKKIDVSIDLEGDYVVIRTRDYGPGIPQSELPKVKKRFYKGSLKSRGSGIGLAICDEIIARHKGLLEIENAPGGGLVTTIKLPVNAQKQLSHEKDAPGKGAVGVTDEQG